MSKKKTDTKAEEKVLKDETVNAETENTDPEKKNKTVYESLKEKEIVKSIDEVMEEI